MSRITSFVFISWLILVIINPTEGYCGGGWSSLTGESLSDEDEDENGGANQPKELRHVSFDEHELTQGAGRKAAVDLVAGIVESERRCLNDAELKILENLFDAGAQVDSRDQKYGSTCLMFAAQTGDLPVVRLCIANGANPLRIGWKNKNAYNFAGANVQVLRELIATGRMDEKAVLNFIQFVNQGMRRCLRADELAIVAELVRAGACVDACSVPAKITALMMAANRGDSDCVCVLLKAGANVFAQSATGEGAFHFAAKKKRKNVLRALAAALPVDGPPEHQGKGDKGDEDDLPPPGLVFGLGGTMGSF